MAFTSFDDLKAEYQEGVDFSITTRNRGSNTLVMAIHGGGIAAGTSEIAQELADRNNFNLYIFSGDMSSGNSALRISATDFDEPRAMQMVEDADRVISFIGPAGTAPTIRIGGLDSFYIEKFELGLERRRFDLVYPSGVTGREVDNIVNLGARGRGIQLDLTTGFRQSLFESFTLAGRRDTKNQRFWDFIAVLGDVLQDYDELMNRYPPIPNNLREGRLAFDDVIRRIGRDMNKLMGRNDSSVRPTRALEINIDTRNLSLSYDSRGRIERVTERDRQIMVRETFIRYEDERVSSVTQSAGNFVIRYDFSYTADGALAGFEKTVEGDE